MTTDQLERDLRTLAEPRETDERLRSTNRARLGEQMLERRPRSRPALQWVAVTATAAAIAMAVILLGGPSGSGGPSTADAAIIHHALSSLALPANTIVHVKEAGIDGGTPVGAEWWQQTDPPYALRIIKGAAGQEVEAADDGTTSSQYDPASDSVVESPAKAKPMLVDPIAGVRRQLASGGAKVAGKTTIDGQSLYRIELPSGLVGYFDTTSYQPKYLDNPQRDGGVVRTRVLAYEELPITAANAKLLSISAQHPQARVVTGTAPIK